MHTRSGLREAKTFSDFVDFTFIAGRPGDGHGSSMVAVARMLAGTFDTWHSSDQPLAPAASVSCTIPDAGRRCRSPSPLALS